MALFPAEILERGMNMSKIDEIKRIMHEIVKEGNILPFKTVVELDVIQFAEEVGKRTAKSIFDEVDEFEMNMIEIKMNGKEIEPVVPVSEIIKMKKELRAKYGAKNDKKE